MMKPSHRAVPQRPAQHRTAPAAPRQESPPRLPVHNAPGSFAAAHFSATGASGKLAEEERLRGIIASLQDEGERNRLTDMLKRSSFLSAGHHASLRKESNPYDEAIRLKTLVQSLQRKLTVTRARLADARVDTKRMEHALEALIAESAHKILHD